MPRVIEVRRMLILLIAAASGMCPVASWPQSPSAAAPQTFPVKPVRYVVPFGPGASPDIVGRLIADRLTRLWGQQVIVDNRAGVAGVLGTAFVAKSPPDGHTLVQCNIASSAIGVSLFAKMPYDQVRDIARGHADRPHAEHHHRASFGADQDDEGASSPTPRRNPGKLSYASGQVGTSPQLSMELLKLMAKIDVVNIPYKIGAQGITDNIAGQVPVGISNFPASVAPVQSGRLRPLAVTSATRVSQLPDVPTVQEAGLPGFDVNSWQGVCAPAAHARGVARQAEQRYQFGVAHPRDSAAPGRAGDGRPADHA